MKIFTAITVSKLRLQTLTYLGAFLFAVTTVYLLCLHAVKGIDILHENTYNYVKLYEV